MEECSITAALAVIALVLACMFMATPAYALTVAPQDQDAVTDFYAVLHEDGSLVFQAAASDEADAENIAGDLAGYASAEKVPWHAYADRITSVRFAESFASLQPLSTKYWFQDCASMRTIDLANLDTSRSDSMRSMFNGCSALTEVRGIESMDTSSSTYFGSMFRDCSSLTSLDVSHFNAAHVEVLCFMFNGCSKLEELSFAGPGWKSPNLRLMVHVWEGCSSLKSLDLSGLDTSHVTSMTHDFNGCSALEYLNLSTVDTSSLGNMASMFDGCENLKTVVLGSGFSFCGKETGDDAVRKVALPAGNWKSAASGRVFVNAAVPNNVADTYTLTTEPVSPSDPVDPDPVDPDPADSEPIDISKAKVTLAKASSIYTGKVQKGVVSSVMLGTMLLKSGVDYKVDAVAGKNAGSYVVIVTGKDAYTGKASAVFKITKASPAAKRLVKSKTFRAAKLKKAKKTFVALKVTADGKVSYKVTKNTGKKCLSFKNGKLTVKKGAKKGTYKLTVKVSAKAGKNYKALKAKAFAITVKVK